MESFWIMVYAQSMDCTKKAFPLEFGHIPKALTKGFRSMVYDQSMDCTKRVFVLKFGHRPYAKSPYKGFLEYGLCPKYGLHEESIPHRPYPKGPH